MLDYLRHSSGLKNKNQTLEFPWQEPNFSRNGSETHLVNQAYKQKFKWKRNVLLLHYQFKSTPELG